MTARRALMLFVAFAASPMAGWSTQAAEAAKAQLRCGWFLNPTPSNAVLVDRDGEWTIAHQGGFQAEGDWPEFEPSQWVSSGVASYGYGCACLRVLTDEANHRIARIVSAKPKALAACRRDKALKKAAMIGE